MDDYGWKGQGSPSQPDTGIAQVLAYYARYGGELLGARRSDNPLTLTHVRWHGQSGHVFDAVHSLDADGTIEAAEREVWVQLALDLPVAAAGMFGARAPWERLALDQDRAAEMLNQLRRSLASSPSRNSNNPAHWSPGGYTPQPPSPQQQPYPQQGQPYPNQPYPNQPYPNQPYPNQPYPNQQYPSNQGFPSNRPDYTPGWNRSQPAAAGTYPPPVQPIHPMQPGQPGQPMLQQPMPQPMQQQMPPQMQPTFPPHGSSPQNNGMGNSPFVPAYGPRPGDPGTHGTPGALGGNPGDAREWTNSVRMAQGPEVTVIPCIEVELPPVLRDPAASDQARDFTRNVAIHFNQSVSQLAQVRETRGWMRNGRMVLAARIAVAPGSRVPSHMEMDGAARMLSETLNRNMLPFTRIAFAEPGEWAQGIALPD